MKKFLAALAGLALISAPVTLEAHPHRYGYHQHYNRRFGTGLILGLGIGALAEYTYERNYYRYVPECPPGSFLETEPYTGNYTCTYR